MRLSREEEEMLSGKQGFALRKAMEMLVAVGETYGAERMIEITGAHLVPPDLQFWTTGDLGRWSRELTAESLGDAGCFRVQTTINPVIFDPNLLGTFGYPPSYVDEMNQSMEKAMALYESRGVIPTYSCCPFFLFPPRMGEHLAASETTVQVFVNSVFGGRTNREGGPTALASALTGRTPLYGVHLTENRLGEVLVELKDDLHPREFTYADYSALSCYVGGRVSGRIPVFSGLPPEMSVTELLYLARSLPTTGGLVMFHAVGITPEAPTLEAAFGGRKPLHTVVVGEDEIRKTFQEVCSAGDENINWVLLGCPHATLEQISQVARHLEGENIHKDVRLILATTEPFHTLARKMGLVEVIQQAGGHVLSGVCSIGFPRRAVPPGYPMGVVATDSAGAAHLFKVMGVPVWFGSVKQCAKAAVTGRWEAA